MEITPFERMFYKLEEAGYKMEHFSSEDGAEGYRYWPSNEDKRDVVFYFGMPTGKEWYWQLDGKIAVENLELFDKWSKVPFYVWLPETDEEAERIMDAIEFLKTDEGYNASLNFENINKRFGFEIPVYAPVNKGKGV